MTPENLALLLSDSAARRVFAAVTLGASTSTQILTMSELTAPEAAAAVGRLLRGGLVLTQAPGRLVVAEAALDTATRMAARRLQEQAEQPVPELRGCVRGLLLTRLPEDEHTRRAVLGHVAEKTFEVSRENDERTVTDLWRPWCQDNVIDPVSLRRFLVDDGFVQRESGVYRLGAVAEPAQSS